MAVILGTIDDRTLGWTLIGSLVLCWFALIPIVLAVDSRIVFGLFTALLVGWLLIVAVRLIQTHSKFIGWGIIVSMALFLVLSLFTTRGVPLSFATMLFAGWAGFRLVRMPKTTPPASAA